MRTLGDLPEMVLKNDLITILISNELGFVY